jgi:hypothetical protein
VFHKKKQVQKMKTGMQPIEGDVSDATPAADIEQLRLCYDRLRKKKEQQEKLKLIAKDPSVRQMELYEEGKKKLMIERSKEDSARDDSSTGQRRDPTPIPICDRLYDEGMAKVMAEKEAEKEAEERLKRSSQTSRNPSPIPICDRLYREGIAKEMTKLLVEKEAEERSKRSSSSSRNPSPIPICDRLYEEGMTKLLTEKVAHQKEMKPRRRSRHSISPMPICDRLYEEGMSKMMAEKMVIRKQSSNTLRKSSPMTKRMTKRGSFKSHSSSRLIPLHPSGRKHQEHNGDCDQDLSFEDESEQIVTPNRPNIRTQSPLPNGKDTRTGTSDDQGSFNYLNVECE